MKAVETLEARLKMPLRAKRLACIRPLDASITLGMLSDDVVLNMPAIVLQWAPTLERFWAASVFKKL
jgi:hypothetical protein